MRNKKKTPEARRKQKLDKLFSLKVREVGVCQASDFRPMANHSEVLQCAHRKSRRYLVIRWDFRNADCLCAGCHRYFHDHPDIHKKFVDYRDPGAWDYLNEKLQNEMKPNYEEIEGLLAS